MSTLTFALNTVRSIINDTTTMFENIKRNINENREEINISAGEVPM